MSALAEPTTTKGGVLGLGIEGFLEGVVEKEGNEEGLLGFLVEKTQLLMVD